MFTGLVERVGAVAAIRSRGNYRVFDVAADFAAEGLEMGESIACDGACLTVVDHSKAGFTVEASQESLARTVQKDYRVGTAINLERALRVGDRIGGHFVTGHVDDVGTVDGVRRIGESIELTVCHGSDFDPLVVEKGSIAINGVSLTVNEVRSGWLSVNVIPHTVAETTLARLARGHRVNLEFDLLGKYVLKSRGRAESPGVSLELLKEKGW